MNNFSRRTLCQLSTCFALILPFGQNLAVSQECEVLQPQPFIGITQEMTASERASAGLHELTPQQIEALDRWLSARFEPFSSLITEVTTQNGNCVRIARTGQQEDSPLEMPLAAQLVRAYERGKTDAVSGAIESPFEARIVGGFTGWSGKTKFRLDNGQGWQQRARSKYRHDGADSLVRFEKNWLGGWEMTVQTTGKSILVRQVN